MFLMPGKIQSRYQEGFSVASIPQKNNSNEAPQPPT